MVKVLLLSFENCFSPITMVPVEGSSETGFLDIYLTTYFGVCKLENISAMRVIFFLQLFKIKFKFTKTKKIRKYFLFLR